MDDYIDLGCSCMKIAIITEKGYKKLEFEGHNAVVTRLSVKADGNFFLSIAGTSVKAWQIPDMADKGIIGEGNRTPSPIQRQEGYTDMFKDYRSGKRPCFQEFAQFKQLVDWACFSSNDKIAICSSKENRIQIYFMQMKQYTLLCEIKEAPATSCIFMDSCEQLIVGCSNSDIRIYTMNYSNDKMVTHKTSCFDSYPTRAIFNLPEDKFAVLTSKTLSVWENETNRTTSDSAQNMKAKNIPCLRHYLKEKNEMYECCAVAPDGSFMAVATSSGKILICKVSDGSLFRELSTSSGNVKYLEIDRSEEHNLVACLEDGSVKLWTIGDVLAGTPTVMSQNFAVAWTPTLSGLQEPTIVAPTSKGVKIVHVAASRSAFFDPFKPIEEDCNIPSRNKIVFCSISKCAKYIMVATCCEVFLVINVGKKIEKIMEILDFTSEKIVIHQVKIEIVKKTITAAVMLEKSVKIWRCSEESIANPNNGETVEVKKTVDRLSELYIIPDTESLVTIGSSGCIKRSNNILGNITTIMIESASFDVNVNATDLSCNKILAIMDGKGKLVKVYDLENSKKLYEKELSWAPKCCSFSPNGERLVFGCHNDDNTEIRIQVLDSATGNSSGEMVVANRSVHSVCVSDVGVIVALIGDLVVVGGAVPRGQARLQALKVVMAPDASCAVTVDSGGHHHVITWGGNTSVLHLVKPRPHRMANATSTLAD